MHSGEYHGVHILQSTKVLICCVWQNLYDSDGKSHFLRDLKFLLTHGVIPDKLLVLPEDVLPQNICCLTARY